MASTLLFTVRSVPAAASRIEQFARSQAEPLDSHTDPGPFLREKSLAFALQQQIACAGIDEHATTSPLLDESFVDQLLISLQYRKRIDPAFGRDVPDGRQRIGFVEHTVEYHGDDTVAKLSVNRLAVVPLSIHAVFQMVHAREVPTIALMRCAILCRCNGEAPPRLLVH